MYFIVSSCPGWSPRRRTAGAGEDTSRAERSIDAWCPPAPAVGGRAQRQPTVFGDSTDDIAARMRDGRPMDARSLDDAAARLRNLRREQRANLVLAAAALVLAVATTKVDPSLALPLFLG